MQNYVNCVIGTRRECDEQCSFHFFNLQSTLTYNTLLLL